MKHVLLAVALVGLSNAAVAQTTTADPQGASGAIATNPGSTGMAPGLSAGTSSNAGQLDFGRSSSSGIATAGSPSTGAATANPGQLDLQRNPYVAGGGGTPSRGAGIGTGSAGVPMTDDVYTQPIYGGAR